MCNTCHGARYTSILPSHLNFLQGIVCSVLYLETGSVYAPAILHWAVVAVWLWWFDGLVVPNSQTSPLSFSSPLSCSPRPSPGAEFTPKPPEFTEELKGDSDLLVYYGGVYCFPRIFHLVKEDLFSACFSLVLVFVFMWFQIGSLFLAVAGALGILSSFAVSLAFWKALGQPAFTLMQGLSIYVILGVGCDDYFVFSDAWKQSLKQSARVSGSAQTRFQWSWSKSVHAMIITSFTTGVYMGCTWGVPGKFSDFACGLPLHLPPPTAPFNPTALDVFPPLPPAATSGNGQGTIALEQATLATSRTWDSKPACVVSKGGARVAVLCNRIQSLSQCAQPCALLGRRASEDGRHGARQHVEHQSLSECSHGRRASQHVRQRAGGQEPLTE